MKISKTSWHYDVWNNWYVKRGNNPPEQISLCVYCRQLGWILFFTTVAAVARVTWMYCIVPFFMVVFSLAGLIFNIWARCIFMPFLLLIGFYLPREWLFNLKLDTLDEIEEYWLPTVMGHRVIPGTIILGIGYIWAITATILEFKANGWAALSDKNFGNSVSSVVVLMHMMILPSLCLLGIYYTLERYEYRFQLDLNQTVHRRGHRWLTETTALLGTYLKSVKQRVCPIIVFINGED